MSVCTGHKASVMTKILMEVIPDLMVAKGRINTSRP